MRHPFEIEFEEVCKRLIPVFEIGYRVNMETEYEVADIEVKNGKIFVMFDDNDFDVVPSVDGDWTVEASHGWTISSDLDNFDSLDEALQEGYSNFLTYCYESELDVIES